MKNNVAMKVERYSKLLMGRTEMENSSLGFI